MIMVYMDQLMHAGESTVGLNRAIETIVVASGCFNKKGISRYLEAYQAKMLMRDISKAKQLTDFARVVTLSIHMEILELQANSCKWEVFERGLFERYGLDNSLRLSKKYPMDWIKLPRKERNTIVILHEFERHFVHLKLM